MKKITEGLVVVIKMIMVILGASLMGMLLLWAVYTLPSDRMAAHVLSSENTLRAQDDTYDLLHENYGEVLDRGTNIIMLHEVIEPSTGSSLKDSLLAPTANFRANQWGDWADTLMDYASNRDYGEDDFESYARYWHGYLIFLKPMLMFMDLQDIYQINVFIQIALVAVVFYLFYKRLGKYCIAYALTIMTMNPINIAVSFQLSTVFYALQITLLLLLCKKKWKEHQVLFIFLLDGILVAYFDFLTYPLVAFAIPLLAVYMLHTEDSFLKQLIRMIKNGLSFVLGYAGMWGMKWVYASALTDENVIADGISSVLHRTGVKEDAMDTGFMSISIGAAISRNVKAFLTWSNIALLIVFTIICILIFLVRKQRACIDMKLLVFGTVIAVSPIMWYILLNNHSSLHPHLEWREMVVFTFAYGVILLHLTVEKRSDIGAEEK